MNMKYESFVKTCHQTLIHVNLYIANTNIQQGKQALCFVKTVKNLFFNKFNNVDVTLRRNRRGGVDATAVVARAQPVALRRSVVTCSRLSADLQFVYQISCNLLLTRITSVCGDVLSGDVINLICYFLRGVHALSRVNVRRIFRDVDLS